LILDESGKASFRLAHGQAIRIENVPVDCSVQITETEVNHYQAGFTDSEFGSEFANDLEQTHDTGLRLMTENREFCFINERIFVPPTGVDSGNIEAALLLTMLILTFSLIGFVFIHQSKLSTSKR